LFVTGPSGREFELLNKYGAKIQYLDISNKDNIFRGSLIINFYYKIRGILINARQVLKCLQMAIRWKADIIHFLCIDDNEFSLYIAYLIYKVFFKKKYGYIWGTLHSVYFINNLHNKNIFKKLFNYLKLISIRTMLLNHFLSGVFVHTSSIREDLIMNLGKKKKYKQKIIKIPYPVELFYKSTYSMEAARKRLSLPQNIPLLLFFGELRYNKGIDIVIDAIRNLNMNFRLVIAGHSEYFTEEKIKSCLINCKNYNKIIFRLDYPPEEQVKYYFLSADVVILAHRKSFSGQSGPLVQACAAGKPIIASKVGEIGKIIEEKKIGILYEAESPIQLRKTIEYFLKNKENIITKYRENCIKYAKEVNWRNTGYIIRKEYLNKINIPHNK